MSTKRHKRNFDKGFFILAGSNIAAGAVFLIIFFLSQITWLLIGSLVLFAAGIAWIVFRKIFLRKFPQL